MSYPSLKKEIALKQRDQNPKTLLHLVRRVVHAIPQAVTESKWREQGTINHFRDRCDNTKRYRIIIHKLAKKILSLTIVRNIRRTEFKNAPREQFNINVFSINGHWFEYIPRSDDLKNIELYMYCYMHTKSFGIQRNVYWNIYWEYVSYILKQTNHSKTNQTIETPKPHCPCLNIRSIAEMALKPSAKSKRKAAIPDK